MRQDSLHGRFPDGRNRFTCCQRIFLSRNRTLPTMVKANGLDLVGRWGAWRVRHAERLSHGSNWVRLSMPGPPPARANF